MGLDPFKGQKLVVLRGGRFRDRLLFLGLGLFRLGLLALHRLRLGEINVVYPKEIQANLSPAIAACLVQQDANRFAVQNALLCVGQLPDPVGIGKAPPHQQSDSVTDLEIDHALQIRLGFCGPDGLCRLGLRSFFRGLLRREEQQPQGGSEDAQDDQQKDRPEAGDKGQQCQRQQEYQRVKGKVCLSVRVVHDVSPFFVFKIEF